MNREMFVRVATTVLRQMGHNEVYTPEQQAEAIAAQMDIFAAVLGDAPPPAPPAPGPPPPAFPRYNPEAIAPVSAPEPSLIVPATTMADVDRAARDPLGEHADPYKYDKMAAPAPPVRSLRPPGRMKVEDLNQLIQERTPTVLPIDVPMEDGNIRRVSFQRNVISMHNFDSVKLTYYPAWATSAAARESVEVSTVLHIDEVPFDLPAILKKLTEEAVQSIRPQGAPRQVPVRPFSGPVQAGGAYADGGSASVDSASSGQIQAVFGSLG